VIYGGGRDISISEIARFIKRFGFFPVIGKASGLRQPIHYEDVATVSVTALEASGNGNRSYNISGGEILAYRDMVSRIFIALGRKPRLLAIPLWVFYPAVAVMRLLPRYRKWSAAMAGRMNRDLVFDHGEAVRDLGFSPRKFVLTEQDMP
jgi:nucleoside-diphosphate-sugar epimerase